MRLINIDMVNNRSKKIAEKVAKILLEIKAVSFLFNPPFTYTSGLKSPIYLDNRIIMSYPKKRKQIIDYYISTIKKFIGLENIDYISGTATAAIPQASWVAWVLNLPMVYVRPSTKSYGKGNKLEGHLTKGVRVVIVEDHISTATSVVNNAKTLREVGGKVTYCVATTTYESKQSKKLLSKNKIKLISLTTGRNIIEQALKSGLLKPHEKEKVDLWLKDPSNWGKRMGFEV